MGGLWQWLGPRGAALSAPYDDPSVLWRRAGGTPRGAFLRVFALLGVSWHLLRYCIVLSACGNAGHVFVRSELVVGDGSYVTNKFGRYNMICRPIRRGRACVEALDFLALPSQCLALLGFGKAKKGQEEPRQSQVGPSHHAPREPRACQAHSAGARVRGGV